MSGPFELTARPTSKAVPHTPPPPTHPGGAIAVRAEKGIAWAEALHAPGRCPNCHNHCVVPVSVYDADTGQYATRWGRCRCRKPLDQCRNFNAAQIPARYSTYSFDSWQPSPLQKAVYQTEIMPWITRMEGASTDDLLTAQGLVLCGAPGRGKTHLAVGLLRRLVLEGRRTGVPIRIRYVEPNQLLQTMKAQLGGVEGDRVDLARLVDVDVMLIDDLILPRTEFERSVLDELITRRWQRGGPTLVTTNLAQGEIEGNLSPRVVSRLADRWLQIPGSDLRRKAA